MGHIFISHAEKDLPVANEIIRGLEASGYFAWYFERDTLPGTSYISHLPRSLMVMVSENPNPNPLVNNQIHLVNTLALNACYLSRVQMREKVPEAPCSGSSRLQLGMT